MRWWEAILVLTLITTLFVCSIIDGRRISNLEKQVSELSLQIETHIFESRAEDEK